MQTQKPLRQMIPEILVHIERKFESNITFAREQVDIYEGDVRNHVERSIRNEILSPKALQSTIERIVPINMLKQEVDKLSSVYDSNVSRIAENEADQEWLDWYVDKTCINQQLTFSNKMFNIHRYCGVEPYLSHDGKPQLRVLDASRYIPYSDDPVDPNNATVAIKWISNVQKEVPAIDAQGRKLESADRIIREVKLYYLYSSTEFLIMDGDGDIRTDLMEQAGNAEGKHSIGMLPIIHVNASAIDLVPLQDTSKKDITVSVSKKLTDLSYASLYQSHSLMYGVDVDVSGLDASPDAFLNFASAIREDGSPGKGEVGILQPKINVQESLQLIQAEVSMHLKSLGLNPGDAEQGANNVASVASGVSKMIDEAGSEKVTKEQREIYKKAEELGLWPLLASLHNIWLADNKVEYKKGVSKNLAVDVGFEPKKPSESEGTVIDNITKKLDAGLTSRKRAIAKANPDLDNKQVDELIAEIDAEKELVLPAFNIPAPTEEE